MTTRPRNRRWFLVNITLSTGILIFDSRMPRAIDMADDFPRAEIIGVNLAPIDTERIIAEAERDLYYSYLSPSALHIVYASKCVIKTRQLPHAIDCIFHSTSKHERVHTFIQIKKYTNERTPQVSIMIK
ncbi:hypothetical protein J132_07294 [Termitomyces sp. J132]|nr:hypothetical protein J132_07294 [Termitomyces sp. J132]